MNLQAPLIPKDPTGPLRVILIGRISTPHQSLENIEASYAADEKFLRQYYDGHVHIKHLGERGSGLRTDRQSIIEAEEEIESGTWDLVLMEDLSRAYRNPRHQHAFVQDAVDADTRVICIGDNLDTADPQWELMMGAATLRHGMHIPDTRRRVRRTADYAFQQGGMVLKVRYGYRKLSKEEAASGEFGPVGLRIARIPEATAVIQEMRRRVLRGQEYGAIADWLNEQGILPGRYTKSRKWVGKTVVDLLKDPLLQGQRRFRTLIYQPIYRTGKHRREKNATPEFRHYPELAHLTAAEQEELWQVMRERSARNKQKSGSQNPRYRIPRSRGIWPSKHVCCAICGGVMERTLNDQLKCKNAFEKGDQHCWNHVQVKAEVIRQKVLPPLIEQLEQAPGFREILLESAWKSYSQRLQRSQRVLADLGDQLRQFEKERENLVRAIRAGGPMDSLVAELQSIETRIASVQCELKAAEALRDEQGIPTREAFAEKLVEGILATARDSYDFTDLMRDYVTEFVIQPIQALDSTQVFPRAKLTLRIPPGKGEEAIEIRIVADCFTPSAPVQILDECRKAKADYPDWGCRRLSRVIPHSYMAIKRTLHYLKLMQQEGLTDPFRELQERPAKAARWVKRPKNKC
ncbi:recombinase family protein [Planctomicrobium sp. SH527]|uniref:recombinase family protein n=1 Tax=Planctomicrobium sp. SH527 TaxID=3448123 RepID=UPI003F5B7759